jgi:hypothetical protein
MLSSCDIYNTIDITSVNTTTQVNTQVNTQVTTHDTTQVTTHDTTHDTTQAETQTATQAETQTTMQATTQTTTKATTTAATKKSDTEAEYIKSLFDSQTSDVWVSGSGKVTRILKDDNEGDRHQRFILELSTGQTLLFAHNIDIAPRIDDIAVGETISFYGEYIYSDEGGTLHWTHHDPDGSSDGGWLKKGEKIYE